MELKIWQAIDVVDNELSMFATNGKRVVIATWTRNHDCFSSQGCGMAFLRWRLHDEHRTACQNER